VWALPVGLVGFVCSGTARFCLGWDARLFSRPHLEDSNISLRGGGMRDTLYDKALRVHVPVCSCGLVVADQVGWTPMAKTLHRFRESQSASRRDEMRDEQRRAFATSTAASRQRSLERSVPYT